jgi:hypothetical protein
MITKRNSRVLSVKTTRGVHPASTTELIPIVQWKHALEQYPTGLITEVAA